jgi:hypothetical protein
MLQRQGIGLRFPDRMMGRFISMYYTNARGEKQMHVSEQQSSINAPNHQPSTRRHVAISALLVAALFAFDKVLGVVRDVVVSRTFGTSAELDAYYAAFELPDGLFTVVAGSALATALIPVLSARVPWLQL